MCNNVIDINKNEPHEASEVICINCKKRWVALRPQLTLLKDLQCPQCLQQGGVIETGEIIYELADE